MVFLVVVSCHVPGPSGNAPVFQNQAMRIVDQASLAGKSPCSEGRGGLDRWCVFFTQKQSATRGQDVWAVNISRVGRGVQVSCHQPGPDCIAIALGDHVVHWGFVADTLIIDGVPPGTSASARVAAPVTAWRPEWDSAVPVTIHPVSGCWVDLATESVACLEQGPGDLGAPATDSSGIDAAASDGTNAAASATDAGAAEPGTFYAGRLTRDRRALTVVPKGREAVQALVSSDSLFVFLSPGGARVHLGSGSVEILPAQLNSQFAATPDEAWLLSFVSQKTNLGGTRSLVATPFPAGSAHHVLIGDVARHHFVEGPRAAGADVVAITAAADGTNRMVIAGPDSSGAGLSMDLGSWAGTTTDKLDATSGGGYAVVADTQGTVLLSLLAPGPPCLLSPSAIPMSQVLTVPRHNRILWVAAAAGAAGAGLQSVLDTCVPATTFATSATSLELVDDHHLLFTDAAKHLMRLDLSLPDGTPESMRDADEVVYRWAYVDGPDLLVLDMTSVFDTVERLYVLPHPFD